MPNSNLEKKIYYIPDNIKKELSNNFNNLHHRLKNYLEQEHLSYYDMYNILKVINNKENTGSETFNVWVKSTLIAEKRKDKNRRKTLATYTDNQQIKQHDKNGSDAHTRKKIYEVYITEEQYKKIIKNEK